MLWSVVYPLVGWLLLLITGSTQATQHLCPPTLPRGEVVCYFEAQKDNSPLWALDPCSCTIIIIRGATLDDRNGLALDVDFERLDSMKANNTELRTVLSLGGESIKGEVLETLVKTNRDEFVDTVTSFVEVNGMDGVEVDWRWPGETGGGSKTRGMVTKLMRNLRASLDQLSTSHSVAKRSADEAVETTTGTTTDTISTTTPLSSTQVTSTAASVPNSTSTISTTTTTTTTEAAVDSTGNAPAPEKISDGFDLSKMVGAFLHYAMGTPYPEDDPADVVQELDVPEIEPLQQTTEKRSSQLPTTTASYRGSIRFTDYYKPGVEVASVVASETASSGWTWPEDTGSEDEVTMSQSSAGVRSSNDHMILVLTLPLRPEYLVKGYEIKELVSVVDFFSLGSHNLSSSSPDPTPLTYHHSRLMGVADIENTDSLIDLVRGLGAPLEQLLMGVPASGAVFTLEDRAVTMPRAPALGPPVTATYSQVCELLKEGDWTTERDEDLTGPYAFMNNTWVAFEDTTSIRIKSKYALLRGLAGVALHDLEFDDWRGSCEDGTPYPLLTAVRSTLTQLVRTPRRAVLESLVEDLEMSGSSSRASYAPSPTNSRTFSTSPFKIVRIVDRNGDIRALRSNENSEFECTRQGYYRNPNDCSQFYRCVKFDQYIDDYTVFEYECPIGLVFDDRWEVCAWPSAAPPCDGSSEIFPVPRQKNVCPGEGYFADPENCRWFFACRDYYGNGTFTQYEFRCPFGLAYDEENGICNWSWLVGNCGDAGIDAHRNGHETSNIQPIPINQVTGGLFSNRNRGGGKAIEDGSDRGQSRDTSEGNKVQCLDCAPSPQLELGGRGILDPKRGLIVGHDTEIGRGLKNTYDAPNSRYEENSNNRINSERRQEPVRTSGSGQVSPSRTQFDSGNEDIQNSRQSYQNAQNSHTPGSTAYTYSVSAESDENTSQLNTQRYNSNNFERKFTSGRTTDSDRSNNPNSGLSYKVPQSIESNIPEVARVHNFINNDRYSQSISSGSAGKSTSENKNEGASSYSYPEPDIPFNPTRSKDSRINSYTQIESKLSQQQQPPQRYGPDAYEVPGINFSDENSREASGVKYDKSTFGHNVQSEDESDEQILSGYGKHASVFVKVKSEENVGKSGDSKETNEGYRYTGSDISNPFAVNINSEDTASDSDENDRRYGQNIATSIPNDSSSITYSNNARVYPTPTKISVGPTRHQSYGSSRQQLSNVASASSNSDSSGYSSLSRNSDESQSSSHDRAAPLDNGKRGYNYEPPSQSFNPFAPGNSAKPVAESVKITNSASKFSHFTSQSLDKYSDQERNDDLNIQVSTPTRYTTSNRFQNRESIEEYSRSNKNIDHGGSAVGNTYSSNTASGHSHFGSSSATGSISGQSNKYREAGGSIQTSSDELGKHHSTRKNIIPKPTVLNNLGDAHTYSQTNSFETDKSSAYYNNAQSHFGSIGSDEEPRSNNGYSYNPPTGKQSFNPLRASQTYTRTNSGSNEYSPTKLISNAGNTAKTSYTTNNRESNVKKEIQSSIPTHFGGGSLNNGNSGTLQSKLLQKTHQPQIYESKTSEEHSNSHYSPSSNYNSSEEHVADRTKGKKVTSDNFGRVSAFNTNNGYNDKIQPVFTSDPERTNSYRNNDGKISHGTKSSVKPQRYQYPEPTVPFSAFGTITTHSGTSDDSFSNEFTKGIGAAHFGLSNTNQKSNVQTGEIDSSGNKDVHNSVAGVIKPNTNSLLTKSKSADRASGYSNSAPSKSFNPFSTKQSIATATQPLLSSQSQGGYRENSGASHFSLSGNNGKQNTNIVQQPISSGRKATESYSGRVQGSNSQTFENNNSNIYVKNDASSKLSTNNLRSNDKTKLQNINYNENSEIRQSSGKGNINNRESLAANHFGAIGTNAKTHSGTGQTTISGYNTGTSANSGSHFQISNVAEKQGSNTQASNSRDQSGFDYNSSEESNIKYNRGNTEVRTNNVKLLGNLADRSNVHKTHSQEGSSESKGYNYKAPSNAFNPFLAAAISNQDKQTFVESSEENSSQGYHSGLSQNEKTLKSIDIKSKTSDRSQTVPNSQFTSNRNYQNNDGHSSFGNQNFQKTVNQENNNNRRLQNKGKKVNQQKYSSTTFSAGHGANKQQNTKAVQASLYNKQPSKNSGTKNPHLGYSSSEEENTPTYTSFGNSAQHESSNRNYGAATSSVGTNLGSDHFGGSTSAGSKLISAHLGGYPSSAGSKSVSAHFGSTSNSRGSTTVKYGGSSNSAGTNFNSVKFGSTSGSPGISNTNYGGSSASIGTKSNSAHSGSSSASRLASNNNYGGSSASGSSSATRLASTNNNYGGSSASRSSSASTLANNNNYVSSSASRSSSATRLASTNIYGGSSASRSSSASRLASNNNYGGSSASGSSSASRLGSTNNYGGSSASAGSNFNSNNSEGTSAPKSSDAVNYKGSSVSAGSSFAHFGGSSGNLAGKYNKKQSNKQSSTPNVSPYGKHLANPKSLGARIPVNNEPSIVAKLGGYKATNIRKGFQRFGPGGFRDFDDTLGPEVCERPGLFRHPDSCDKFYECYWDRWIEKFTLHVFDCPVTIVYDSGITACNWPFNGPPCTDKQHA